MTTYYLFFAKDTLPQPNKAHLIQVANSANAAANLGIPTVLAYLEKGAQALKPSTWIHPFHPKTPSVELVKSYNLQEKLKVASLPVVWPFDRKRSRFLNSSTLVCKYYFPIHIRPFTRLVHTRDWNFVKAAVRQGIPAIYEHHHHEEKQFEIDIVQNPLFQIAVTVADTVRESMIQQGMPPEKVIKLHNGFNHLFLLRQPEKAAEWRGKLLKNELQFLVVYAGALQKFKGIDLLIEVAKELPYVQFALAGGSESQVKDYQQRVREQQIDNICFLGYLNQDQLTSLVQAADALAHPHLSGEAATFTSPLKLFDYLASGNPIIATEIPSLTDFRSSNAIAGWCEPDNPFQFAQCLQQVLDTYPRKPEGYSHIVEFARQFSWESRITKILNHVDASMRPSVVI
jgi:glycosyltransferase involved in cell wall biosynthesis